MAQNSEVSANKRRRGSGRPFSRGVSGNPGGRPRAALDVQTLAREHTAKAIETLVKALDDGRLCVSAAVHLLERGWGRPLAPVTLDGTERVTSVVLNIVSARDPSADDLDTPGVITITAGDDD